MPIEEVFQVIEALAVVIGIGFAMVQVRQYRRDKHREAAMELLHAFQTPSFARALNIIYSMPEDLSKKEIEQFVGGPPPEDSYACSIVLRPRTNPTRLATFYRISGLRSLETIVDAQEHTHW